VMGIVWSEGDCLECLLCIHEDNDLYIDYDLTRLN
jgi:hypothetical protein